MGETLLSGVVGSSSPGASGSPVRSLWPGRSRSGCGWGAIVSAFGGTGPGTTYSGERLALPQRRPEGEEVYRWITSPTVDGVVSELKKGMMSSQSLVEVL